MKNLIINLKKKKKKEEAMPWELTVGKQTALAKVKGYEKLQSPAYLATLTEQVSESFVVLWQEDVEE